MVAFIGGYEDHKKYDHDYYRPGQFIEKLVLFPSVPMPAIDSLEELYYTDMDQNNGHCRIYHLTISPL
ncbi:hypothetical protein GOARA_044_00030 [Gordonia araii NBRC 100433]|uniref:Uncharacterized protein n=1 Tax=Gordonia araii NBRC 100433 TaxID=1073574 RepID=G7H1A4_9ACTN|nr:hypothetical protein GOARA_044_00030 [Gordonia araii NBRC 100433]